MLGIHKFKILWLAIAIFLEKLLDFTFYSYERYSYVSKTFTYFSRLYSFTSTFSFNFVDYFLLTIFWINWCFFLLISSCSWIEVILTLWLMFFMNSGLLLPVSYKCNLDCGLMSNEPLLTYSLTDDLSVNEKFDWTPF